MEKRHRHLRSHFLIQLVDSLWKMILGQFFFFIFALSSQGRLFLLPFLHLWLLHFLGNETKSEIRSPLKRNNLLPGQQKRTTADKGCKQILAESCLLYVYLHTHFWTEKHFQFTVYTQWLSLCLFGLLLELFCCCMSTINSYGHVGIVSFPEQA